MSDGSHSTSKSHVVPLRRSRPGTHAPVVAPPPVADLGQFEISQEPDDYRHRMTVNVAAFLFLAALIGGGIWLVDTMARMQRDQECVLTGRRGCTPVEVTQTR